MDAVTGKRYAYGVPRRPEQLSEEEVRQLLHPGAEPPPFPVQQQMVIGPVPNVSFEPTESAMAYDAANDGPAGGGPGQVDLASLISALEGARRLVRADGRLPACPGCSAENGPDARFCAACGARLRMRCPECNHRCRIGAGHCDRCGLALSTEVISRSSQKAEKAEAEARTKRKGPLRQFADRKRVGGRYSSYYRATRRDTGEARFLKHAQTKQARMLVLNEASALEGVDSPHVVRLVNVHRHFDEVLLELERVDKLPLAYPLPVERLLELMRGAARGLAAIHAAGLVHGDLKPQNILCRRASGEAVLIDLECAQAPGPSRFGAYTPMFAAPEQVFGDHFGFAADVYAFGVTLYLLFTYDRVPSILDKSSSAEEELAKVLSAEVRRSPNFLTAKTLYGGYTKKASKKAGHAFQAFAEAQTRDPAQSGAARSEAEALGAKYFFTAELERLTGVNRRLDLTGEVLALVSEATEIDPARRPPDGAALLERLDALCEKAGVSESADGGGPGEGAA